MSYDARAPAGTFRLFWHRAGNTPRGVEQVSLAARHGQRTLAGREVVHGVELDLKWTQTPRGPLLYAHHGPTGRERLRAAQVYRRAEQGGVHLLDDLLAASRARSLHYLIELKCGHGPAESAMTELAARLESHEVSAQTWLASSSLELLAVARRFAPALPRVLFCAPLGKGGRVFHKPTTYVWKSLIRHGLWIRLGPEAVQLLCLVGLRTRSLAAHSRLAEASRKRGLVYLPGRVTRRETLEGLAASGAPGAFVYALPDTWPAGP